MTAEIALLNRTALAFAADSAVTIRIGASQKIYDSAEKLFEFSRRQPIGLMIYNNVEYVGVPLDIIIRKHRSECVIEFDLIKDAANNFLDYITEFKHDISDEKSYLYSVLTDKFSKIQSTLFENFRQSGGYKFNFITEFDKIVLAETEKEEALALKGFLPGKTFDDFNEAYGDVSDAAANSIKTTPITDDRMKNLRRYSFSIVKSGAGSDALTGLVFGGFAKKDLFPTLYYTEIDGIYFGELKVLWRKEVDIDRRGERAQMVPFAQKEMADRFIYGVDEAFQSEIGTFVQHAIDEVMKTKPRSFTKAERKSISAAVLSNFSTMLDNLRHAERDNILDILNFMSKKELAEMSYALVELTSKKRKFSNEQETVGGPIDVAIVTRNEGFIWIRRKHYFDRDANQGYFARVFGSRRKIGHDIKAGETGP